MGQVVRSLAAVTKHSAKVARVAHSVRMIQVDLGLEEGDNALTDLVQLLNRVMVLRGYVEEIETAVPDVHHVPTVTTAANAGESP